LLDNSPSRAYAYSGFEIQITKPQDKFGWFYWKSNNREARINWLNKQIKKLENG